MSPIKGSIRSPAMVQMPISAMVEMHSLEIGQGAFWEFRGTDSASQVMGFCGRNHNLESIYTQIFQQPLIKEPPETL